MRTVNGKDRVGYRFSQYQHGKSSVIFEGEDFGCSPLHPVDSDRTVAALLGFLTLRPGDTDREYFDSYTPAQMDFASQHAEALACYVSDRFGE